MEACCWTPRRRAHSGSVSTRCCASAGSTHPRTAGLAAGCFLFCTRNAFVAVGGFDEAFYGAEELVMSQALKRHGKFVVLRQAVMTSGRKLRTHSVREMLAVLARLALRGPGAVKQRQGMDLWYAERREDPQDALTSRLQP